MENGIIMIDNRKKANLALEYTSFILPSILPDAYCLVICGDTAIKKFDAN